MNPNEKDEKPTQNPDEVNEKVQEALMRFRPKQTKGRLLAEKRSKKMILKYLKLLKSDYQKNKDTPFETQSEEAWNFFMDVMWTTTNSRNTKPYYQDLAMHLQYAFTTLVNAKVKDMEFQLDNIHDVIEEHG